MKGQMDLFSNINKTLSKSVNKPLAQKLRPLELSDFIGQEKILSQNTVLRKLIEKDEIGSMIFWGPPGVGKTTLARIIASKTKAKFIEFSAVNSGIKDVKDIMNEAVISASSGNKTIIFIDEIHRFNKSQQDAFLPFVEDGSIVLIGATTENPSFEINKALLSRCKVFVFDRLSNDNIKVLLKRAVSDKRSFPNKKISIEENSLDAIVAFCNGDARIALNMLEMAVKYCSTDEIEIIIKKEDIDNLLERGELFYDKDGEEHYNLISAMHKSMRNSDVDAAVYWVSRMLEGGEDPLYIARRMIQFANEDIGMADSNAFTMAINAFNACRFMGMPDCDLALIHTCIYLSLAPKSDAVYVARKLSRSDVYEYGALDVPMNIRNAPTKLMEDVGYGKGYKYAHSYEEKTTDMQCMPDKLIDKRYYIPNDAGEEKNCKIIMEDLNKIKKNMKNKDL